ncbi:hypothetical protein GN958_ATG06311 [Phytophthora infestans]|uniref:Uncharacterized protein n=1 Tax=Phytophthora infestans TaxID=4787 RepID=A0A8S9UVN9_PHYIN|nr:hypothetical protein GN958_ATG06311 [Phytophthora infestans]
MRAMTINVRRLCVLWSHGEVTEVARVNLERQYRRRMRGEFVLAARTRREEAQKHRADNIRARRLDAENNESSDPGFDTASNNRNDAMESKDSGDHVSNSNEGDDEVAAIQTLRSKVTI